MISEQVLVNKWRNLPPEKQQEVIDFVEFIELRMLQNRPIQESQQISNTEKTKSALGQRLRAIREEFIASGVHLLNAEEIERERQQRQGGYQGDQQK